jgi:peptide/nickel transport system permease protein
MAIQVVRRVLVAVPVLWAVLTLTFIGFHLVPGGPAEAVLGGSVANGTGRAVSSAEIHAIQHHLGLDRPLQVQYWDFLTHAASGDFGHSFSNGRPVWDLIWERVPYTAELAAAAWLLSTAVGLVTGILAAVWNRRPAGMGITACTVLVMSVPNFWLGTMLGLIFGAELHWLPVAGTGDARHLVLPAVTVAAVLTARLTRQTRSAMVESLSTDYTRTAWAKGLRPRIVILRHALRNALVPLVTILGLEIANLLGGVVIVENIFDWPGLGTLAVGAVTSRDLPVIEGTTFFFAVILVTANFLVDLCYRLLDPRMRTA